jgi:transposase
MSNFRDVDRQTGFLLPPSVDEWLPQRHLARFVVEVIDGLDLRALVGSYRGSGSASYHPSMLLGLLVYGYATGVFASRKLERATYDSVAFRFIAANDHPDHDTIATFRRRFLKEITELFVKVLMLAREMGVLQLGTVALDGTKIHANASRHSALSYEHAGKLEAQLKAEVGTLLAKAEAADQADIPDGMSIPEELERREARLKTLAEARAKIEARASERLAREQAEYETKMAAREAKARAHGKKPGGKPPAPPVAGPGPSDQINLTDADSRIMPVAGGGFEQCYNAQAAVTADSLLVVATDVVQAANDKQQIEPMLGQLATLPTELGLRMVSGCRFSNPMQRIFCSSPTQLWITCFRSGTASRNSKTAVAGASGQRNKPTPGAEFLNSEIQSRGRNSTSSVALPLAPHFWQRSCPSSAMRRV